MQGPAVGGGRASGELKHVPRASLRVAAQPARYLANDAI
jgi:hypothetical protein